MTSRKDSKRVKNFLKRNSPNKKTIIKVGKPLKKGSLTKFGYKMRSPINERHRALRKAAKSYSKGELVHKLNIQATYRKRSDPKLSKSIKSDINFVQSL